MDWTRLNIFVASENLLKPTLYSLHVLQDQSATAMSEARLKMHTGLST